MKSIFLVVVCYASMASASESRATPPGAEKDASDQGQRIVTSQEIQPSANPAVAVPLRVIFFPFHALKSGMEAGLIKVEKERMRERLQMWTEYLRERGITAIFGGLGEGTGFGLGGSYTVGAGGRSELRFLGRASIVKGYGEFDVRWQSPPRKLRLWLEGSYQWRPQENFYGLGMDSRKENRTQYALRQTWSGLRFEFVPMERLRFGSEYRIAWVSARAGTNPVYASPDTVFPGLPGFGRQFRLQSTGIYARADGIRGEYQLGGAISAGASYQDSLDDSRLKYLSLEALVEGRLPIARGRSALVSQGEFEFNRPRGGSAPIPFFLLPHIGGSSTLRGFNLDRFYGKNIFFVTLEYRYQIHPNFQSFLFFDEGQIFDKTGDLTWLNWQRNYGFGLRMHSARGTIYRLEIGWSGEGFQYHITWGDRERRPLGGPIRYGIYRR